MSCNYNKPKPTPAVLFKAKIFHFHKMKSVVTGELIRFLCVAFVTGLSAIVYTVTLEESQQNSACLDLRKKTFQLCRKLTAAFM